MIDRSKREQPKLPKIYGFNTFFYQFMIDGGYQKVRRWTTRANVKNQN